VYAFIDDAFVPLADASIPVNDLAVTRGYGVFDYLKVLDGRPVFLSDHLNRLFYSANEMRLSPGYSKKAFESIIEQLVEKTGQQHCGIRITLTGGSSIDGYSIGKTRLVITSHTLTWPAAGTDDGISLSSISNLRQLAHVKTIDYLFAIRMQPLLEAEGADDFLYHHNGLISESPRANFFIVTKENVVITPAENILKGITRNKLVSASSGSYKILEGTVSIEDALDAKEAFITSTTKGVMPVNMIDGKQIGNGSREFIRHYQELLQSLIEREA
jgi:D-alanine transaminase/branched-chain amino acid aminotransferase